MTDLETKFQKLSQNGTVRITVCAYGGTTQLTCYSRPVASGLGWQDGDRHDLRGPFLTELVEQALAKISTPQ